MARPALAATRAMDILNFLAASPTEAFSLSELVQHLGLNFASCHALLSAMTREGYLDRHPKHKTYSLGPALVAIGNAALESHPAIDAARDAARELAQQFDLEVLVTARIGGDLMAIARAGRYVAPNATLRVGRRIPMVPPLGAPFMAWAPAAEVETWLASEMPQAAAHHREVLQAVRERGWAATLQTPVRSQLGEVMASLSSSPHAAELHRMMTSLIGELDHNVYQLARPTPGERYDVTLLSAPIFNAQGHVAYTLSLLGFPAPMALEQIETYASKLIACSLIATRRSNGRAPSASNDVNAKRSMGGVR